MKHQPGDKVKVRPDLRPHTFYDSSEDEFTAASANYDMVALAGETVTIAEPPDGPSDFYFIEEDGKTAVWVDTMFEEEASK